MPKNFVILFQEKEGSSAIVDTLQRFPDINVVGFEPFDRYRFLQAYHGGKGRDMSAQHLLRCLTDILDTNVPTDEAYKRVKGIYSQYNTKGVHHWPSKSAAAPKDFVLRRDQSSGFKMRMRPQIRSQLFELWARTGTVVFVMYREDVLKWAISKYRSGHLQFKLADGRLKRNQIGKITVDHRRLSRMITDCEKRLKHKQSLVSEMQRKGVDARLLRYEKFCFNKKAWLEETLTAIDCDVGVIDSVLKNLESSEFFKKVHSDDLRQVISNYDVTKRSLIKYFDKSDRIRRAALA